jgi:hypothetical protein
VTLIAALLGVAVVRAAIVDLDAWWNTPSSTTATRRWPMVRGSTSWVAATTSLTPWPRLGGTNYIAYSATGDDVILGAVQINLDNYSNGTFFTTVQYDSDQVKYVYIRFFDFTNRPLRVWCTGEPPPSFNWG